MTNVVLTQITIPPALNAEIVGKIGEQTTQKYVEEKYKQKGAKVVFSLKKSTRYDISVKPPNIIDKIKNIFKQKNQLSIEKEDYRTVLIFFDTSLYEQLQKLGIIYKTNYTDRKLAEENEKYTHTRFSKRTLELLFTAIKLVNYKALDPAQIEKLNKLLIRFNYDQIAQIGIDTKELKKEAANYRIHPKYLDSLKAIRVLNQPLIDQIKPLMTAYMHAQNIRKEYGLNPDILALLDIGEIDLYESKGNQGRFTNNQKKFIQTKQNKIKIYLIKTTIDLPKTTQIEETQLNKQDES